MNLLLLIAAALACCLPPKRNQGQRYQKTRKSGRCRARGHGWENCDSSYFADCWTSDSCHSSSSCVPGPVEPCCPIPDPPEPVPVTKYFLCRVNFCETDPFKICGCYGYNPVTVTEANLKELVYCICNAKFTDNAAVVGYDDIVGQFVLDSHGNVSPYDPVTNPTDYALCEKTVIPLKRHKK